MVQLFLHVKEDFVPSRFQNPVLRNQYVRWYKTAILEKAMQMTLNFVPLPTIPKQETKLLACRMINHLQRETIAVSATQKRNQISTNLNNVDLFVQEELLKSNRQSLLFSVQCCYTAQNLSCAFGISSY